MNIKTISAQAFSAKDYDQHFLNQYYGVIEIEISTPYMVGTQIETQVITLNLIVLTDSSIDTSGMQIEARYKGEYGVDVFKGYDFYSTELTTQQFDSLLLLDEVKREIAMFGYKDLAA